MIQTTFVNGISPFGPRIESQSKAITKQAAKQEQRILLRESKRADVLAFINANPGCNSADIGKAINRQQDMCCKYLRSLIVEGQIVRTSHCAVGRNERYKYWAVQ